MIKNMMIRTAVIAAVWGVALSAHAVAESPQRLDVPAGELVPALQALAKQADVELMFRASELQGVKTLGVSGTLLPSEAIKRLLEGTDLKVFVDSGGAILVGKEPLPAGKSPLRPSAGISGGGFRVAEVGNASDVKEEKREELSEVLVTATKRAERIQDVPISITAITSDEIDRRGLIGAEDYLRGMPGVNQIEGLQGQGIVIRGMETTLTNQSFQSGTTVATYFGETPTTNSAGLAGATTLDLKLVDIERVEVLRGPQGTTFGNSSLGGAVRTIPVAPRFDRFEGKVAVGYSDTSGSGGDSNSIQAVANFPLITDRLAIRAVGYRFDDSGFYRNAAGSNAAFQTIVDRYGVQAFATDKDEVGDYYVLGGRIAALYQASENLQFRLSYLSQKSERDGIAIANSGRYEQLVLGVAPEHVVHGRTEGFADTDIDIANAVMEYNFGWADLIATYSDTQSKWRHASPDTNVNVIGFPLSISGPSPHREHVGEIRLATKLDGAWNFLAGLYAEELKDEVHYTYYWYGSPQTRLATFPTSQTDSLAAYNDVRNQKQKAAFGEVSWEFMPGFTLTGGARAYDYDRTIRLDNDGVFYGPTGVHRKDDSKESGATFRANLSYKIDRDGLVYAGWAQGFRLGRPQAPLPAGVCDINPTDGVIDGTNIDLESTGIVTSDSVNSYELGGKFAFLNRRLTVDADVFRMEWSDVPVRVVPALLPPCNLGYVANAGKALSEGVELQTSFQINEPFRIELGGSWIHARLTEDVPAQGFKAGNRLPGSPKVNANLGLQYSFNIGTYPAFVRADSIYVGPFYGNLLESPTLKSGDYVKFDAAARVSVGSLSIDLFAENLTNEDAFTFRGNSTIVGQYYGYRLRPRTFGVRLGYSF